MKVEIEIPDERVLEAINAADVRYWASYIRGRRIDRLPSIIEVQEESSQTIYGLTLPKIHRAIDLMVNYHPEQLTFLVNGDNCGTTGDLLIQLAIFGEEKYA